MMKSKCSECGNKFGYFKSLVASNALPVRCPNCNSIQFRQHELTYSSIFPSCYIFCFAVIYLFITKGLFPITILIIGYIFIISTIYISETYLFDMIKYDSHTKKKNYTRSIRSVLLLAVLIISGFLLTYFDK